MRLAITGASGFVGRAALRLAREAGHDVLALSRRPVDGAAWQAWDLEQPAPAGLGMADAVIHAAAHVDDAAPWPQQRRVTVDGTQRVIDAFPGARMVLVSSCSVYPLKAPGQRFTEDVAPAARPLSTYVRAKLAQEQLVTALDDWMVLRPHAVYGPGDTTLLPRFQQLRRRGRLLVPSGRDVQVHLTHVDLLARAALAAAESSRVGLVNVSDAEPVPMPELVAGLARTNGWREKPLWLGAATTWRLATLLDQVARLTRRPARLSRYQASHLAITRHFDNQRLRDWLDVHPASTRLEDWHP